MRIGLLFLVCDNLLVPGKTLNQTFLGPLRTLGIVICVKINIWVNLLYFC